MRNYPSNPQELTLETKEINAQPWQMEVLKINPSYNNWGNYEDYMSGTGGWSGALFFDDWSDFGTFTLDDYNELVNFYFETKPSNTYNNVAVTSLQLWFLHPRKGCSRGILIKEIKYANLPDILKYLTEAKERNNAHLVMLIHFNLTK